MERAAWYGILAIDCGKYEIEAVHDSNLKKKKLAWRLQAKWSDARVIDLHGTTFRSEIGGISRGYKIKYPHVAAWTVVVVSQPFVVQLGYSCRKRKLRDIRQSQSHCKIYMCCGWAEHPYSGITNCGHPITIGEPRTKYFASRRSLRALPVRPEISVGIPSVAFMIMRWHVLVPGIQDTT